MGNCSTLGVIVNGGDVKAEKRAKVEEERRSDWICSSYISGANALSVSFVHTNHTVRVER